MVANMVDRTEDFRKAVKALKKGDLVDENGSTRDHGLLRQRKQRTEFSKTALELVKSISDLRDFLLEHRNAYINTNQILGSASQSMSDHERDKIDDEAQNIIKKCNEAIVNMRANITQKGQLEQVVSHKQFVLNLIQNHLKSVCKIYSEQRAIRVKLVVDKKRISRLHNPETHKKALQQSSKPSEPSASNERETQRNANPLPYYDESDDELSESEAATLEQENKLLFSDMNSMVDEVRAIEGKVVEIARLQEIFSEQVMKQEGEIEMVAEKVVESTENVKDGNEALREAIKNNAGFRVWILFFLVMCSFSLLFLEWYS